MSAGPPKTFGPGCSIPSISYNPISTALRWATENLQLKSLWNTNRIGKSGVKRIGHFHTTLKVIKKHDVISWIYPMWSEKKRYIWDSNSFTQFVGSHTQKLGPQTPYVALYNDRLYDTLDKRLDYFLKMRESWWWMLSFQINYQRWSPRGHILMSLASKLQLLENCPVLGSRTALFFELSKVCGALEKYFG